MIKYGYLLLTVIFFSCYSKDRELDKFYEGAKKVNHEDFVDADVLPTQANLDAIKDSGTINSISFIGSDKIALLFKEKNLYVTDTAFFPLHKAVNDNLSMVSGWSLTTVGDSLLLYDLTGETFHYYTLPPQGMLLNYNGKTGPAKYSKGLTSIAVAPDKSLLATSINNIEGRVIKIANTSNLEMMEAFGTVPQIKEQSDNVTGTEFRSSLTFDKDTRNIFVAHFYTDLIEALDPNGKTLFKLYGPRRFRPAYKIGLYNGSQFFQHAKNTAVAYYSIASDNRYIYALYSGTVTNGQPAEKYIYIFKKDGTPYKRIKCLADIHQIKCAPDNKRLYGYKNSAKSQPRLIFYDAQKL